jgi:ABC-type amino acid transport substrate-binding protein
MFARYAFGRAQRVTFVCAPTAAREPLITSGRVDLVISTFTWTADRATRIDFSEPYYNATGRLLVKNSGPVQKLSDIKGRTIATTSGSVYDRWMKNCYGGTNVITTDTFTNAKLAMDQGRADAVMFDDAVLLPIAAADPNSKIADDTFLSAPYGIGMRKGNTELKAWVDSRLEVMRKKDQFLPILKANVPPRFLASFSKNILRPNQTFQYPAPNAPSVDTVCQ